jgi:hypothetical protein
MSTSFTVSCTLVRDLEVVGPIIEIATNTELETDRVSLIVSLVDREFDLDGEDDLLGVLDDV